MNTFDASISAAHPVPVAIVNDDPADREIWSLQVEEAGFRPVVITQPPCGEFASVAELVSEVEKCARWAVCDHRLSQFQMAQFSGAEAVAKLNERRHTPSLLVTTWGRIDVDVSIRRYRSNVPVLLSADDFQDPETIRAQLKACSEEVIDRRVPPHRVPRRCLVQIEEKDFESGIAVVDAVIPGWNPNEKVRFPLDLIDDMLHAYVMPGAFFTAYVNRGAFKEEDLFLECFELAPEVNPNDGLS